MTNTVTDAMVEAFSRKLNPLIWELIDARPETTNVYREAIMLKSLDILTAALAVQPDQGQDTSGILQDDLRELLQLLGMFDGARAGSPHVVFQDALAVLRQRLAAAPSPAGAAAVPASGAGLREAIKRIGQERRRQIESEGWTPEHDDKHADGEMLSAAMFYYTHAKYGAGYLSLRPDGSPVGWPWDREWWKPKDPVRNLERAGALAIAERERILRQRANYPHSTKTIFTRHVDEKLKLITDLLAELLSATPTPPASPDVRGVLEAIPELRLDPLAADLDQLINEFFDHDDTKELSAFLWNNKIGILRKLQAFEALSTHPAPDASTTPPEPVREICTYGPTSERKRVWMLMFEDRDRIGVLVFLSCLGYSLVRYARYRWSESPHD